MLPTYDDASVLSINVIKGHLINKDAELLNVHGRNVWVYQFEKANNNVELMHTVKAINIYKKENAKIKDSHPAGIKRISYEFINTAPVKIAKYHGSLSVPSDSELFGVVLPKWSKKKKTFELGEEGGLKVVMVSKNKLKRVTALYLNSYL